MKNFCKQGVENRDFISTTYGETISHHSIQHDAVQKHNGGDARLVQTEKKSFLKKCLLKNRIFISTTYEEYFFKHKKGGHT